MQILRGSFALCSPVYLYQDRKGGGIIWDGIYYVTCRNKACRYSVKIYGDGDSGINKKQKKLEEEILNSKKAVSEKLRKMLQSGERIDFRTTYLCPQCHEWKVVDTFYIFEAIHVSPYGSVREYQLHYLEGEPVCKQCGGHLFHILNPRSS